MKLLDALILVIPPVLLILASLLAFAGANHAHIALGDLALPVLILLAVLGLIFGAAYFISRRNFTAAAKGLSYFALLWLLFHFLATPGMAYLGAAYNGISVLGLFIAAGALLYTLRCRLPFTPLLQQILLVFTLILLTLQLPGLGRIAGASAGGVSFHDAEHIPALSDLNDAPHIVYIVPDRYASDAVLRDLYAYDNSGFSAALRQRGFYVWDNQYANYPKTFMSVAATLNMNYLNELADKRGRDSTSYVPVYRLLRDNQLLRILQARGYDYVHLGNWWEPTRTHPRADLLVSDQRLFSEFTAKYFSRTPLAALNLIGGGTLSVPGICALTDRQHEAIINRAAEVDAAPAFFFWHLFTIHDPYLYDENGDCRTYREFGLAGPGDRAAHYLNQIGPTNERLLALYDALAAQSARPVVFMILSDEGPFPWEYLLNQDGYSFAAAPPSELRRKFSAYAALHLPSAAYEAMDGQRGAINMFRLVLNDVFDAGLELHDHRFYRFDRQTRPYDLEEIGHLLE